MSTTTTIATVDQCVYDDRHGMGVSTIALGTRRRFSSIILHRHTSPIQRCPDEILSTIFLFCLDSCSSTASPSLSSSVSSSLDIILSPIYISQTCARFREIALATSRLWANIVLTHPLTPSQLECAEAFLYRSKPHSRGVDLLLDFRDPEWNWDEDCEVAFQWEEMFDLLQNALHGSMHRWRRVEVLADTWKPIFAFLWETALRPDAGQDPLDDSLITSTSDTHTTPIPPYASSTSISSSRTEPDTPRLLESLALSRCNAYFAAKHVPFQPTTFKMPMKLFGGISLDKLKDVSLVGVHIDWTSASLRGLERLELKYHSEEVMPSVPVFLDVLRASPALRHLTIFGWGARFDTEHSASPASSEGSIATLTALETLKLGFIDAPYAARLLSLLCIPSLAHLSIEDVSYAVDHEIGPQDASPILEALISHEAPLKARSRCIELCRIRSLELRRIWVEPQAFKFERLFERLTSLERLMLDRVTPMALSALEGGKMLPETSSGEEREPGDDGKLVEGCPSGFLCPSLTSLTCKRADAKEVVDALRIRLTNNDNKLCELLVGEEDDTLDDLCSDGGISLHIDEGKVE